MTRSGPADDAGTDEAEAVLAFHGLVMNGGVAHAIEVSEALGQDVAVIVAACAALRLDDLGELVRRVASDDEADEEATDRWSELVPTDAALEGRIREASGE